MNVPYALLSVSSALPFTSTPMFCPGRRNILLMTVSFGELKVFLLCLWCGGLANRGDCGCLLEWQLSLD